MTVRLVPLGGLGEVGLNCMAFEQDGRIVLVDCGASFPDRVYGVDLVHPRFDWLLDRVEAVEGIVLTHGHEDHIGALPYFLASRPVPVYGPGYALELVARRLEEHGLRDTVTLRRVEPRVPFRVGPLEVEPVRVAHSMPDATALVVRTRAGVVVHSGDFKLDPDPPDGQPTDEARLREVAREGVRLLLSDSTNAWVDGEAGSERIAIAAIERLVASAPARVVVALFASNVHRLRATLAAAERADRLVCLLGRSMRLHVESAVARGLLPDPAPRLVAPDDAARVPRSRLLVLATGTQAEPPSALARLATGQHPHLALEPGDRVVLSARAIPGAEAEIARMVDGLLALGVEVRSPVTDPDVHVSGHACRVEQRRFIDLVEPAAFIPIHGTRMHLHGHAALAREAGVGDVLLAVNGDVVRVDDGPLMREQRVPVGRVAISAGAPLDAEALRMRARMAAAGATFVHVRIDRQDRRFEVSDVTALGLGTGDGVLEGARAALVEALRADLEAGADDEALGETAARVLARFVGQQLGRRPAAGAVVTRAR